MRAAYPATPGRLPLISVCGCLSHKADSPTLCLQRGLEAVSIDGLAGAPFESLGTVIAVRQG
jgi:hypothetical protein